MKHLADGLVEAGHQVRVLTMGSSISRAREGAVELDEINVADSSRLPGLGTWASFLWHAPERIRRAVREFQPDVVNSHFVFPAGFVVRRAGVDVPHVTSVVGADVHDPTRRVSADRSVVLRWLSRTAVQSAFAVTTPSQDLTNRALKVFPKSDVRTVPWGVPLLNRSGRTRADLGLADDAFVVTTLCRLVRRKRLDLLIRAVAQLPAGDTMVVIMGSGPEQTGLQELAASLGVAHRVRFTGRVSEEEKRAYLEHGDVFCLPSDHEGFGLVFLEAMGLDSAVVCTDVGGQTDIVREGIDGHLIPVDDESALVDRLRMLQSQPERLREMKRSAAQRAREFTPDRAAADFLEIFGEAIDAYHIRASRQGGASATARSST